MKYFIYLEDITYELNDDELIKIKNLFNKLYLQNYDFTSNSDFLINYTVADGETPESVSYKYYGTTEYWWIVMMINNIKDVFYDWPMMITEVKEYAEEMQALFPDDSQYDTEKLIAENEEKRYIKLLKETYLNELISDFLTARTMGDTTLV